MGVERGDGLVSDTRARILARVTRATALREGLPHPGGLWGDGAIGADAGATPVVRLGARSDVLAAFVERFRASGGEVAEYDGGGERGGEGGGAEDSASGEGGASEDGAGRGAVLTEAAWLTRFLRRLDPPVKGVAVGEEVPARLRPTLPEVAAAHAGAGVSMAWGAAADSGSLILPSPGTRSVQLLPPVHVVWVERVFERLEDALRELRGAGLPAAVGLHSGPSKSADIGRTVVTGVHGPGRCIAVPGERARGGLPT